MLAALAAGFLLRPRERASGSSAQLSLELPAPLTFAPGFAAPFALAPDGSRLAIEATDGGTRRLYLRELRDPELRRLPGTDGAWQPFFSADGRWLAFFTQRKLAKVAVGGGPVIEVADIGGNPRGATWASDGINRRRADADGGADARPGSRRPARRADDARQVPRRVPRIDGPMRFRARAGSSSRSASKTRTFDEGRIEAVSLETGERRVVLAGAGFARYLPDNRLLFVRGGLRLRRRLRSAGARRSAARPKCCWTRFATTGATAAATWPCRRRACWSTGRGSRARTSPTCRGSVTMERFQRAVDTPRRFRDLERSPDGGRIAVVVGTSTESDLWAVDANGTLARLSTGLSPYRPTWTADGRGITVGAKKDGKWRLLTDSRPMARASPSSCSRARTGLYPDAWSRDGRHLLFQESNPSTGWDLRSLERRRRRTSGRNTEGVRGVAVPRIDRGDLDRRPMGGLRIGRARRRGADLRSLVARRRPQGPGIERRRAAAGLGPERRAVLLADRRGRAAGRPHARDERAVDARDGGAGVAG